MQNFRTRQACSDSPAPGQASLPREISSSPTTGPFPALQVRLDPFPHASCPTSPTYNVIAWLPGRHRNRLAFPCPPPAQIPDFCKDTTFITTHQHSPNDLVKYITPPYAAQIARVMASVAASMARAPLSPTEFNARGNPVAGVKLQFEAPEDSRVDHYVVAARSINEKLLSPAHRHRASRRTSRDPANPGLQSGRQLLRLGSFSRCARPRITVRLSRGAMRFEQLRHSELCI